MRWSSGTATRLGRTRSVICNLLNAASSSSFGISSCMVIGDVWDQVPFQSQNDFQSAAVSMFLLFFNRRIPFTRKNNNKNNNNNIPRIMFRSKARRRFQYYPYQCYYFSLVRGNGAPVLYPVMQLSEPAWSRFWHRRQVDLFDQGLIYDLFGNGNQQPLVESSSSMRACILIF